MRYNRKERVKHRRAYFLPLLFTVLLFGGLYFLFVKGIRTEETFNRKDWIEKEYMRTDMLDDLTNSLFLIGKSKAEVFYNLGKPLKNNGDSLMAYDLYPSEPAIGFIKYQYLLITFNNGKVITVNKY